MKFLVADDELMLRELVVMYLSAQWPEAVIVEAEGVCTIMRELANGPYDLVLMNINFRGRNAFEALDFIRAMEKPPPVVMLTCQPEEQYVVRCFAAGACGYISKYSPVSELIKAVRGALECQSYISPNAALLLREQVARGGQCGSPLPPHHRLSNREMEVLVALGSGKSVINTAGLLKLSPKTVHTHRANILEKLGLTSTSELIRYGMEHELDL